MEFVIVYYDLDYTVYHDHYVYGLCFIVFCCGLIQVILATPFMVTSLALGQSFDKSTLVQVMAWCLMAPSHYLSQC